MIEIIGIFITLIVVSTMLLIIFIKSHLYVSHPNEVLIFSGRKRKLTDGTEVGFRIIKGGRGFRIPFIENVSRMSLNTMPIEINLSKVICKGMIPVNLEAVATAKIAGTEKEGLANAAERFLGRGANEIVTVARENLEGNLRGVLATFSPEEANENRLQIAENAVKASSEDLRRLGLVLDTLKIQHLWDQEGYLEAVGRKRVAEVKRNAHIAEANAESEAKRVAAEAKKLSSVAESESEMVIVEAENNLKVKRAKLAAESNREEERAIIARDISRVEEQRTLEELKIDMNEKKFQADVVVPAKAAKEADELHAQGKSSTILENGKATAEALAFLQKQWNEGENGETREIMLLQMLPVLLKHVTHVLQDNLNIEKLTVVDSGGGGGVPKHINNLAGSIVGIFEQLKNATGIDIAEILKSKEKGSNTHFKKEYEK